MKPEKTKTKSQKRKYIGGMALTAKNEWLVYKSPLWHKDVVQETVKPLPSYKQCKALETDFVNDAIRTNVYSYSRKKPIIPVYSATKDKYAQAYFQCPLVKAIMSTDEKEMKTREMLKEEKNINKLSHRHRVQRTPGVNEIRAREEKFTNDAIVTETRRTRFKDIIPQYDASADRHCKAYFQRQDVQRLISVTRSREENKMYKHWQRRQTIAQTYTFPAFNENDRPQQEV
ncbi:uncharacterized protein LOC127859879 isoform X4 [Dreissena polymorpha]|uniref:uncharacterized protein LOC127859879 isoform X4 n=1 Tax=Dreissena polymorpha TaxID=45954 RepID=UPI002264E2D1|nr:uncharacterized protein LOC127859879 isoform X4 [Dreissena polymorpha]